MSELAQVLAAFQHATSCEVAVWLLDERRGSLAVEAASPGAPPPPAPDALPDLRHGPREIPSAGGTLLVACVPGPRRAWLAVGPCSAPGFRAADHLAYLLPMAEQFLQSALEVEHAANELAERYEEINLLYTISEILGRTVSLEEATETILREVSETVGARRATVLVYDPTDEALVPIAAIGVDRDALLPISLDDACSVSARVFRAVHPVVAERHEPFCEAEAPYRKGALLSVPILWTGPNGGEPIGVVNLSDRGSGQPFSAGDQKLIAAIATQIGTAIQNARLVRASIEQQRLAREMQLAHDLQMRLLPPADAVAPEATVAARVVPAESVGGDFYNLFRVSSGCTGIMIGDVSGHGYQAALIMALTMSASAIHAQGSAHPGQMLRSLYRSLAEELETTEMFISAFYAVVDVPRRELRFANAGHPHAFIVRRDGSIERLAATDLPLGMAESSAAAEHRPWRPGEDLLLLFTDGVTDARSPDGERLGESRVLETVVKYRQETPRQIADRVFHLLDEHTGDARQRDDLTLVLLRS